MRSAPIARPTARGSRGQIMPFLAIVMVAIFAMMTLAVDIGYYRYQQRLQQTAADSAAIAGAIEQIASTTPSAIATAGANDATTNGYTTTADKSTVVTINNPPSQGNYTGVARAVEAIVYRKQPVFFGGIFGATSGAITTRAVAAPSLAGRACVYALDGGPNKNSSGITINGGAGGFIAPSCDIISNAYLTVNGNGTVDALGIGYATSGPKGGTYPEGQPMPTTQATDPCPTVPGCAYLTAIPPTISGANTYALPTVSNGITTYSPGEYKTTLVVSGPANFLPGLYIFDNGVTATGNGAITGTDVTFYNGAYPAKSGGGAIDFSGSMNVSLKAPTSGNYSGISLYQPASNTNTFVFNGAAGNDGFVGALYFPGAQLKLDGDLPKVTLVVAGSIVVDGGGITVVQSAAPNGLQHFVLVE